MVFRQFIVHHDNSKFALEYDTNDGFEVLKFQIFSVTSIHPDEQKILVEDQNLIINESSDLESVTNNLRLVSIEEQETSNKFDKSDEELARILQAEEDALFFQQFQADENREEFEGRVRPHANQVLMYEDPVRQEASRKSVPIDELEEKSLVSLAKYESIYNLLDVYMGNRHYVLKTNDTVEIELQSAQEGNFKPSEEEKDHAFLLQLLFWFKQSFRWVNQPTCDNCGGQTSNNGMGPPLPSETKHGASRVEIYRCNLCSKLTRFPRYNDPLKLLETRRGRCGEWANCFTLYCRAFGYDSRLILDFTDHVWTECFSNYLGRWMHLDPCEGIYDKPLLYEKGWNKKLTYTIAISKDGVCDVTKRYTRKWHEVLTRRNITTEPTVASVLSSITKERRATYSSERISALEIRDQKEAKELEEELYNKVESSLSLPGRQSGSVEWRIARSELGNNSLSSTSCPIRLCVDSHVKNIYDSLNYHLRHTNDENSDVLATFKKLFRDLRSLTYKERRSCIDLQLLNCSGVCIEGLLSSVSLKKESNNDGKTCICLAGDPVQTALALPVAIDAINELVDTVKSNINGTYIMKFPKRNRICSGLVLASGEELPFGIATSAFDGLQTSKWEEPDGAKGCWLIYKTVNSETYELESYELMSANDAPERDPKDWILEGSDDGGVNWFELDKQSSQFFDKRFQRKTFEINSRQQANAFRFRFLHVRDSQTQSRFQIGSIDLYATRSEINII